MRDILSLLYNALLGLFFKKKFKNYDPKAFFEARYSTMPDLEDKHTLSPATSELYSLRHYRRVEVSILDALIRHKPDLKSPAVLDIGPGAGHWLKFYSEIMGAKRTVGLEIAGPAVETLNKAFSSHVPPIEVIEKDLTNDNLALQENFDIINAIGVIHHIVDDNLWLRAVENMASHLNPGGLGLISGRMGLMTFNDSFIESEDFSDWKKKKVKYGRPDSKHNYLIKRSRSRKMWKNALKRFGCEVLEVIPNRPGIFFSGLRSRFNLLVFRRVG